MRKRTCIGQSVLFPLLTDSVQGQTHRRRIEDAASIKKPVRRPFRMPRFDHISVTMATSSARGAHTARFLPLSRPNSPQPTKTLPFRDHQTFPQYSRKTFVPSSEAPERCVQVPWSLVDVSGERHGRHGFAARHSQYRAAQSAGARMGRWCLHTR
jgi:hypothetical protein